jgi:hypothetical protein
MPIRSQQPIELRILTRRRRLTDCRQLIKGASRSSANKVDKSAGDSSGESTVITLYLAIPATCKTCTLLIFPFSTVLHFIHRLTLSQKMRVIPAGISCCFHQSGDIFLAYSRKVLFFACRNSIPSFRLPALCGTSIFQPKAVLF